MREGSEICKAGMKLVDAVVCGERDKKSAAAVEYLILNSEKKKSHAKKNNTLLPWI